MTDIENDKALFPSGANADELKKRGGSSVIGCSDHVITNSRIVLQVVLAAECK